jgi:hypothetical protein
MTARPLRVIDSYADGPDTLDAIWPTVPQTSEIPRYLGKPMLPPPVGVARYDTRRRFPAPWAGLRFGGAIACLLPLAYAIAESGAR